MPVIVVATSKPKLKGKLEGPLDVVRLEPVPAGDEAKGRL